MEKSKSQSLTFHISEYPQMIGLRLDKALALHLEIATRTRASHLISENRVLVNQRFEKASYYLKETDHVEISLPEPVSVELQPYDFPLEILHEDKDLIVINKPSGLVVHPAAGHAQDTLVNALLKHTKDLNMKFGELRPGIVHRLDKETSGIIVVAKNDETQEALSQQFKERTIHRTYYAISIGTAKNLKGSIQSFLARHPLDRKRYASVLDTSKKIIRDPNTAPSIGKWAVTHFDVIHRKSGMTLLKLKLETGRTHQIRVHLSELGLPIAGDSLYGADKKIKLVESRKIAEEIRGLGRFLLHASELGFTHPRSGEKLFFKKDWPEKDLNLIKSWGF